MSEVPWRREIDCKDRRGRARTLVVVIDGDGIGLGTPADGYGVVDHGGGDQVRAAIEDAQRELARRRDR